MAIPIPLLLYEFSTWIYFLAAIVGILLTYFSFRLYSLTGKREQRLLFYAMGFITVGFILLTISNAYGLSNFKSCFPLCRFDVTDPGYSLIVKSGNYVYYLTSLIGYILLALTYLKSIKIEKFFGRFFVFIPLNVTLLVETANIEFFLYPFDNFTFQLFHLLSIVVLSYINFNTVTNYLVAKARHSFPVMIGFIFIGLYHFLMALTPFKPIIFGVAHLSLLAGLISLLWMLIQVNRRG